MPMADERKRRILTTHVGSLPRPHSLSHILLARMTAQPYDAAKLDEELRTAVAAIVKKQTELGIDIVSDGEQSKTSFQLYATDRLSGLERITPAAGERQAGVCGLVGVVVVGPGQRVARGACRGRRQRQVVALA